MYYHKFFSLKSLTHEYLATSFKSYKVPIDKYILFTYQISKLTEMTVVFNPTGYNPTYTRDTCKKLLEVYSLFGPSN